MAKDLCIMCGKETAYEFETHIDYRIGYVEGAGQLCHNCYTNVPTTDMTSSLDLIICVNEDTILNTPNDYELGEKVRQMYWNTKNS
jgi:hypothetical protein